MQRNAMISVKDAASLLNLDERSIRERLANGSLKGEKRSHGQRDKWFVYASAIEAELKVKQSQQNAAEALSNLKTEEADIVSIRSNQEFNFSPESEESIDAEEVFSSEEKSSWRTTQLHQLELIAEKLMKPLTDRLEFQAMALAEKDRIIEEQGRQIRLLPDLQKQAEQERKAAELKALEVEALQKQIAALEEERRRAAAEAQRISAEKEGRDKVIEQQLGSLTTKLEDLQKPWWKKLFTAGE